MNYRRANEHLPKLIEPAGAIKSDAYCSIVITPLFYCHCPSWSVRVEIPFLTAENPQFEDVKPPKLRCRRPKTSNPNTLRSIYVKIAV